MNQSCAFDLHAAGAVLHVALRCDWRGVTRNDPSHVTPCYAVLWPLFGGPYASAGDWPRGTILPLCDGHGSARCVQGNGA